MDGVASWVDFGVTKLIVGGLLGIVTEFKCHTELLRQNLSQMTKLSTCHNFLRFVDRSILVELLLVSVANCFFGSC